jgi:predicted Zn-dependent protease
VKTRNLLASLLALVSTSALVACATSPEGRKQLAFLPASQMDSMGVQSFNDMKSKMPVERDAATNNYVKCVANGITAALPEQRNWEVVVFKDDTANAFALPGGKIGVHTGLLKVATNQDQLAAVIGHEVGHVLAQHGNERVSEQLLAQGGLTVLGGIMSAKGSPKYDLLVTALGVGTQYGVLLPHSRTQESEADVIGLELMAKAGFNPTQSVNLWQNMEKAGGGQPPEFLSTHPSHGTRISNLQKHMAEAEGFYRSADRKPSCRM